jgi:hypothetical protein
MSTVTVNNIVQSTASFIGQTIDGEIRINVSELAYNSLANLIMLTLDAEVEVSVRSGSFVKYGQLGAEDGSTLAGQTAVVLVAEGPIQNDLVLRLSPSPINPVKWRALGMAMSGPFVRNADGRPMSGMTIAQVDGEGNLDLLESGTDERRAYVGIFASKGQPPTIRKDDVGHVALKGQVSDPADLITAYAWNKQEYTVGSVGQGPWFHAALLLRWTGEIIKPPPTESDDFWAKPGPCEASDVFLINNNAVAPYWDVPEVNVWNEPDTLLLNYTDPDGTRWSLLDIDGWWTLPPPALPDLPRPGYLNGSFPIDGRYEPRIITLRGAFTPGRGVSVAVPRLRLLRALDAVRTGALFVAKEPMGNNVEFFDYQGLHDWEQGPWPKQAWVWLSDQPKVDTLDGTGRTEFEVQLKAVDPVKYLSGARGLDRKYIKVNGTTDGRDYLVEDEGHNQRYTPTPGRAYGSVEFDPYLPAVNKGTTNVWPRFYIFGPATDSKIVNRTTNQTMAFQGSIRTGEVLIVDCYWRTVVLRQAADVMVDDMYQHDINGENRRWMLKLSSPWIYLQQGDNELTFHANGAVDPANNPPTTDDLDATQCWVVYRSGWMGS